MKKRKSPVSLQVYLGSGNKAEKLRDNLDKAAKDTSVSELVVSLLRKAEPKLFLGVDDGK